MSRFRAICFTLNNYSEEEKTILHQKLSEFKYGICQEERGENGTPHLQGYICSENARSFAAWKTTVGARAHIEGAKGTAQQNKDYCSKDECRIPGTVVFESGTLPRQGSRNDIAGAVDALKSGKDWGTLVDEFPEVCVKFYRGLQSVRLQFDKRREWKTEVFWFYGPTGLYVTINILIVLIVLYTNRFWQVT